MVKYDGCAIQGELMGVMRAARQEKEKVKVGMKEREEEGNLLLRKMQERLKVIAEYSRK